MQIIGSVQIVTFVTSVAPTFCAALRFWVFFFCLALLLLLLYLLDCAGVFRSCGSDHGLCPLDSHKPLKRLDRNFYMGTLLLLFRLLGFVLSLRPRRKRFLQFKAKFKPPPPKKNKKSLHQMNLAQALIFILRMTILRRCHRTEYRSRQFYGHRG